MIPHQPKVQRLIKRGYGTLCKMVLLIMSVISVAYSCEMSVLIFYIRKVYEIVAFEWLFSQY